MVTTAAPTRAGTARLSEVARKVVQPTGIVSTGWPAVEQTCRTKLGVAFDEWQAGAGRLILAKREDGSLAAEIDVLHVLSGDVEVHFADGTWQLGPGDTASFNGREPHSWTVLGDDGAELIWVLVPALWSF